MRKGVRSFGRGLLGCILLYSEMCTWPGEYGRPFFGAGQKKREGCCAFCARRDDVMRWGPRITNEVQSTGADIYMVLLRFGSLVFRIQGVFVPLP